MENSENTLPTNFIHQIIDKDLQQGINQGKVHTRFPPEPNGYLHIGHAKSITLNYGTAIKYEGKFNLRFDDTNPAKEEDEYVRSIKEDVKWLGADWEDRLFFASDYFETFDEYAQILIKDGKAYVDFSTPEEISTMRGMPTKPGIESPYRNTSPEDNLDKYNRMKAGEYEEGSAVLRAKIDMTSPNMNMRDPVLYRISKTPHHRQGDKWCIYPMYDWAHGFEDSLEGITYSLCTLEFENHRPLYNWFIDQVPGIHHPRQIEFAPLNITYTVLSKRKLLELVKTNIVEGWDDPRMPTISGLRRRGFTPSAIRSFCEKIGVSKVDSMVDHAFLEFCIKDELNLTAQRRMAVLDPIKVTITNYPEGQSEMVTCDNNPEDPNGGTREVPFTRNLYIERDDFMEEPPKKYFRLSPGKEVRLKHAYYITCTDVVKDESGQITEILCTYDPETKGGDSPDKRKVKGTLHWVTQEHGVPAEVRLYDKLFTKENMLNLEEGEDYKDFLNPESLVSIKGCVLEPALKEAALGEGFQFMRKGYFVIDNKDSAPDHLVFNRTVGLTDSWAKLQKKLKG
ncbi:glutamine--tRNA ligase/YqeY domain fusion protein [Spirochaeta cellobiosiphila]|uniref:glutamine--tRNA ligase/YqeY domain fusion protein n=1 Tax=Spirochaeta cellobiosiphila TaxID=504483 RepID=UPI0003FEC141|nr:glutamine--tRNA ligase/YqeY domain fusion protein [Spirochaeta cellobiosiphila]